MSCPYRERIGLLKQTANELKQKMLRHYNALECAFPRIDQRVESEAIHFTLPIPEEEKKLCFTVTLKGDEPQFIPPPNFRYGRAMECSLVRLCGAYASTFLLYMRVQRSIDALNRQYQDKKQLTMI